MITVFITLEWWAFKLTPSRSHYRNLNGPALKGKDAIIYFVNIFVFKDEAVSLGEEKFNTRRIR
jgi:hypothetical protein